MNAVKVVALKRADAVGRVVEFSADSHPCLHEDDSIYEIRAKIASALNVPVPELYLFTLVKQSMPPTMLYNSLTQGGARPNGVAESMYNFYTQPLASAAPIPIHNPTTATIRQLPLDNLAVISGSGSGNDDQWVARSIGQTSPFIVNPFFATAPLTAESMISLSPTLRLTALLMTEIPTCVEPLIIYACAMSDVMDALHANNEPAADEHNTESEYRRRLMSVYFPVFRESIDRVTPTDDVELRFLKNLDAEQAVNHTSIQYLRALDASTPNDTIIKSGTGVAQFKILLKAVFPFQPPMETIFKIMHATDKVPLIKYNPHARIGSIYRLFTHDRATNGRNIPLLSKLHLAKNIGKRSPTVACYVAAHNIACEFYESGDVSIYSVGDVGGEKGSGLRVQLQPISLTALDAHIAAAVNPLLVALANLMGDTGKWQPFTSISDTS